MYNSGKIISGLVIFLVLVTFPFWYALVGGAAEPPDPPVPEGNCVEDAEYMAAWHMDLLDQWRDEVVREGVRDPVVVDGVSYPRSLTQGCLACHDNKEAFCDVCHSYAGVDPYCWDCHLEPQGQ